jgi:protein phosphatase
MNSPPGQLSEALDLALLSDIGTNRSNNEDSCGHFSENGSVVFAVADGIGGYEGGEIASAMAVEVTLRAYRENPVGWGPAKRLHRAAQEANIEIHNRALTVPELRRMGTTLTAIAVSEGVLHAVHVGDCRLYLIRQGKIRQMTKDHTVVQERVRMGLMSAARAKTHPERSALSRCLGQELIVAVDRITMPLEAGDQLMLCSDGLYNIVEEHEMRQWAGESDAAGACRRLVDLANRRGTADNLTIAICTIRDGAGPGASIGGWRDRLAGFFGRSR